MLGLGLLLNYRVLVGIHISYLTHFFCVYVCALISCPLDGVDVNFGRGVNCFLAQRSEKTF